MFSHSSNVLFFLAYKAFTNDEGRYLQKQEKKKNKAKSARCVQNKKIIIIKKPKTKPWACELEEWWVFYV